MTEPSPEKDECPTCGPTATEPHPRRPGVTRCVNCKEWLTRGQQAEKDATEVTFTVGDGWPTPNHCRRAADALDAITSAHYGDILRAYADAEDARFAEHGSVEAIRRRVRSSSEQGSAQ